MEISKLLLVTEGKLLHSDPMALYSNGSRNKESAHERCIIMRRKNIYRPKENKIHGASE